MKDQANSLLQIAKNSPLLRVLLIGFLILLLQIPISMIEGMIRGRQTTRDEAVGEVTGKWGRDQSIVGPLLQIPYVHRWTETDDRGGSKARIPGLTAAACRGLPRSPNEAFRPEGARGKHGRPS